MESDQAQHGQTQHGQTQRGQTRRRRIVLTVLVVLAIGFMLDLSRPPRDQISAGVLLAGIHLYQDALRPWASAVGIRCRFESSCSRYGEAAIRRFGAGRGSVLTLVRLVRCGPWTPYGSLDPLPQG